MLKKNSSLLQKIFLLCIVLLCSNSVSFAGNRSGIVAAQFLKIPTSARMVGMANASVALAEGVSSLAYNPAGLMSVAGLNVAATQTQWFANIQHAFVGTAANLNEMGIGTIALGMTLLTTDDMIVTTNAAPEGTGEYFRAGDYAFHLAYARSISDRFSVGLATKYIYSFLYNDKITSSSFAFDIGTLYDIPDIGTKLGVGILNLGNDVEFIREPYSLPTALRFGVATTVWQEEESHVISTLQIARPNDADEQYNVGAEYAFNESFFLRGGYKFAYEIENFTAGFGVNLLSFVGMNVRLDYGYNNYQVLPGTHTISLEAGW